MAGQHVCIRRATIADLEIIVENNKAMAKETEGLELPHDTITAGVKAALQGGVGAWYYVLEEEQGQHQAPQQEQQPQQAQPPPPPAHPPHGKPADLQQGGPQCDGGEGGSNPAPVGGGGGGGRVVGQLMITTEWSDWRACACWWIQSVYVAPHARRRGHFRALYKYVRADAAAQGAAGLRLYADVHNKGALDTYEGLGMGSHYQVFEDMFTQY